MNPEFRHCALSCKKAGEHTKRPGVCFYAPDPSCEHPAETICWASDGTEIVCGECLVTLSVRILAENARVSLSTGCMCSGDECEGRCKPRALSWNLDPAKVLAILYLLGDR